MKDLYYIFSEHGKVGPLDSFEIRAALRVGEVDPFDLASKEGSKIKRAIVEIDEIFATPENQFSHEDHVEITLNRAVGDNQDREVSYRPTTSLIKTAQAVPLKQVKKKEQQDARKAKIQAKKVKVETNKINRKDQKKYHIHTQKAKYGPFSARDIIAKYNLGDLASTTTVQKIGVKLKIPIGKFVKIYQKNKNPNIKARNYYISSFFEDKTLITKALWIMVGVAAALLFYFTLEKAKETRNIKTKHKNKTQVNQRTIKPEPIKATPKKTTILKSRQNRFEIISNKPTKTINEPRQIIKKAKPKRVPRPKRVKRTATTKKKSKAVKRTIKRSPPKRIVARLKSKPKPYKPRSSLNVKSRPEKFTTIAKYSTKPTKKKVVKAKPVVKKTPSRKNKPSTSSSLGNIPSTSGKVGQKMRFGPVSYSTSAVASCPAKCVLTFNGRGGTSIRATFFKARFGSLLSRKGGKATISGLVSSGNRFLLQKVD